MFSFEFHGSISENNLYVHRAVLVPDNPEANRQLTPLAKQQKMQKLKTEIKSIKIQLHVLYTLFCFQRFQTFGISA